MEIRSTGILEVLLFNGGGFYKSKQTNKLEKEYKKWNS